jgi:hypothetical protein
MNAKIGLAAADSGSHDGWRVELNGVVKGGLLGRSRSVSTAPATGSIAAPTVRTSHVKLALRRRLDYFKQHVG